MSKMSEELKIYVELPNGIKQLLTDNGLSIESVLRHEDIDVNIRYEVTPFQSEEGGRSKDLTPVIILATALAAQPICEAIANAISKVIKTLGETGVEEVKITYKDWGVTIKFMDLKK